jgi:hypothetical protein
MTRATIIWNTGIVVVLITLALTSAIRGSQPVSLVLASVLLPFVVGVVLASFAREWLLGVLMVLAVGVPLLQLAGLTGVPLARAAWFLSIFAGWFTGAMIGRRRGERRARTDDSRHYLDWDLKGRTFREWSPTAAQVEAKVRALDGQERAMISVVRDHARLDVCGGTKGQFVVFEAADVRDDNSWRMPAKPSHAGEAEVRLGNVTAPVDRGLLIDLESAVAITMAFELGRPVEPEPDWWEGTQVLTVRPSFI